jgi:hypothetical protein
MYELHEHEQYFFDKSTLEHLADFLSTFENPCCLCAPLLGKTLSERGAKISILDIDERFASVAGFCRFDVFRPQWIGENFDVILCDPPFFEISLSQLFSAIRLLARHEYSQPLLISYLKRRETNLKGTFARFELQPTGYSPVYQTVRSHAKNDIEFFSNLPEEKLSALRAASQHPVL